MGLSDKTLQGITSFGFTTPTEVQEKAVPIMMAGKEIIARSKTGSGKTLAFGIGLYELLAAQKARKALILAPVRELAIQIMNELRELGKFHRYRIVCVYGGQNIDRQIRLLYNGVEILVATPGRLLDLFERGALDLNDYDHVVLDEADKMFEMGFAEDVERILSNTSYARKVYLFSATISDDIHRLAAKYMKNPEILEVGEQEKPPQIAEEKIDIDRPEKFPKLIEIIKSQKGSDPKGKILIFVATQRAAEFIGKRLREQGINAAYMHGDVTQFRREKIMDAFKTGASDILVATDIAARGMHIEDIALVVNYDEAIDSLTHLHRIGRTGRMGAEGKAITFVEKNPYFRKSVRSGFVLRTGPYNPYAGNERRGYGRPHSGGSYGSHEGHGRPSEGHRPYGGPRPGYGRPHGGSGYGRPHEGRREGSDRPHEGHSRRPGYNPGGRRRPTFMRR
ncbi:MAG: DEAD/DEAH box helicase [Candidatus ainarchaeum sp.]|nr:DEAD/DEAH box helicase [Candidatus ainarchaeum sp.]